MDKPPLGYYLKKRFYSYERWMVYLDSLDWSTSTLPKPVQVAHRQTAMEQATTKKALMTEAEQGVHDTLIKEWREKRASETRQVELAQARLDYTITPIINVGPYTQARHTHNDEWMYLNDRKQFVHEKSRCLVCDKPGVHTHTFDPLSKYSRSH